MTISSLFFFFTQRRNEAEISWVLRLKQLEFVYHREAEDKLHKIQYVNISGNQQWLQVQPYLGLGQSQECKEKSGYYQYGVDVKCPVCLELRSKQDWCCYGNNKVSNPVGSSCQGNRNTCWYKHNSYYIDPESTFTQKCSRFTSDIERKYFTRHNPHNRSVVENEISDVSSYQLTEQPHSLIPRPILLPLHGLHRYEAKGHWWDSCMQLLFNEPQLVLYPNQYLASSPDPTLS